MLRLVWSHARFVLRLMVRLCVVLVPRLVIVLAEVPVMLAILLGPDYAVATVEVTTDASV